MARKKLADLVREGATRPEAKPDGGEGMEVSAEAVPETAPPAPRPVDIPSPEQTSPVQERAEPQPPRYDPPLPLPSAQRPMPKYLRLQRKEARLREDQLAELTVLSRRLHRQKHGRGERITENTLLRIAVDLLFVHEKSLRGDTEEEIRAGLGLRAGSRAET